MRTAHKRWGAAGAALVIAGAGLFLYVRGRTGAQRFGHESPQEVADRWRGFPAGTPGAAPATGPDGASPTPEQIWFAPQVSPAQLEAAMNAWREAVRERNTDGILTLDRAFLLLPGRYGPELEKLALHDQDERVRAFSARMLGKTKNLELADLFRRFLKDPSPFVRQNGAWALGELVSLPNGRTAAEAASDELRHLEETDPSGDVRLAATKTLQTLK